MFENGTVKCTGKPCLARYQVVDYSALRILLTTDLRACVPSFPSYVRNVPAVPTHVHTPVYKVWPALF